MKIGNFSSIVHTLHTFRPGEMVELIYSPQTASVSATLIDQMGEQWSIRPDNLPKEFRRIESPLLFKALLMNCYARTASLGDQEHCLYIEQKGKGGGGEAVFDEVDEAELPTQIMTLVKKGEQGAS